MEASAILKMVEDALYNHFFIIDVIFSDDDSTMQVVINNPFIVVRVLVMSSSNGKLDEEIPGPSLLADPSHCVKVVVKHIFSIVNKSRAHQCGGTKAYAIQINKYLGYMIKNYREKQLKS